MHFIYVKRCFELWIKVLFISSYENPRTREDPFQETIRTLLWNIKSHRRWCFILYLRNFANPFLWLKLKCTFAVSLETAFNQTFSHAHPRSHCKLRKGKLAYIAVHRLLVETRISYELLSHCLFVKYHRQCVILNNESHYRKPNDSAKSEFLPTTLQASYRLSYWL